MNDLTERQETAVRELLEVIRSEDDIQLHNTANRLLTWTPEITPVQFTDLDHAHYRIVSDDEKARELLRRDARAPFFSEAYLYNLLGKDDARSLLIMMRPFWRVAGIPRRNHPH